MKITRKGFLYSVLSALVVMLILAGLYWTQVRQLYYTIRLFDEDVIVANFSDMQSMIPTVSIKRAGVVNAFGHQPRALPDTFVYQDERRSMDSFMVDSSTTALVVVKGNDISFEAYYQGTKELDQRISWSMAKSFLSAIFGVAVSDGLIPDLNQAVSDYVPALKGSGYDGVSIKNVLQMSSGVYFNEDYSDFNSDINRFGRVMALGGSFDEFAASLTTDRQQGTYMHYVSIDTHVLGMVLRTATGRRDVEKLPFPRTPGPPGGPADRPRCLSHERPGGVCHLCGQGQVPAQPRAIVLPGGRLRWPPAVPGPGITRLRRGVYHHGIGAGFATGV